MYKIIKDYLTLNPFSRPGTKMNRVKGVVVHWVANANTSASANRYFFETRKEGKKGYGSAHYLIDLDGTVIIDIPEDEIAYHVGAKSYRDIALKNLSHYPNNCTLGIECTHLDDRGKMSDQTYQTLVELCADLLKKYNLNALHDLYLHYDITGKICHKWFVDHPDEWMKFKNLVQNSMT